MTILRNILKSVLLLSMLISCSRYVLLEYRTPSDFYLSKNSKLFLNKPTKKEENYNLKKNLIDSIETALKVDQWYMVVEEKPKKGEFFQLKVLEYRDDSELSSSSVSESEGRSVRHATFEAKAFLKIVLLDKKGTEIYQFTTEIKKRVSSNSEMPKSHSRKSLRPFFEAIFGIDRDQAVIDSQNDFLKVESLTQLRQILGEKVIPKFSPLKNKTKIKFLDDEDDMDLAYDFIKASQYENALTYLQNLKDSQARPDIHYNLAVILEKLNQYDEACSHYKRAYELNPDSHFLKEEISCQTRSSFFKEVNNR